jgi:hypothetical protein
MDGSAATATNRRTLKFGLAASGACLIIAAVMVAAVATPLVLAATSPALEEFTQIAPLLDPFALEELVAPIALYPDELLGIALPASTYPLQIVQAARYLEAHKADPSLEPGKDWDDTIVALLNYPEVIALLNADLDWTWQLGEAVLNQQPDVIQAIERFRERALAAGNLESDEHKVVSRDNGVIEIRSAESDAIYVPYYEPAQMIYPQPVAAYYYYPTRYPVYYYPYPAGYPFYSGAFWGLTSAFTVGWYTNHLHVHHYGYRSHPYYGRHYYRPHFRRYPIRIRNSHHRNYRGDYWSAGRGYGHRPRNHHRRDTKVAHTRRGGAVMGGRAPMRAATTGSRRRISSDGSGRENGRADSRTAAANTGAFARATQRHSSVGARSDTRTRTGKTSITTRDRTDRRPERAENGLLGANTGAFANATRNRGSTTARHSDTRTRTGRTSAATRDRAGRAPGRAENGLLGANAGALANATHNRATTTSRRSDTRTRQRSAGQSAQRRTVARTKPTASGLNNRTTKRGANTKAIALATQRTKSSAAVQNTPREGAKKGTAPARKTANTEARTSRRVASTDGRRTTAGRNSTAKPTRRGRGVNTSSLMQSARGMSFRSNRQAGRSSRGGGYRSNRSAGGHTRGSRSLGRAH